MPTFSTSDITVPRSLRHLISSPPFIRATQLSPSAAITCSATPLHRQLRSCSASLRMCMHRSKRRCNDSIRRQSGYRWPNVKLGQTRAPKKQPNHKREFDEREIEQQAERRTGKRIGAKAVRHPVRAVKHQQDPQNLWRVGRSRNQIAYDSQMQAKDDQRQRPSVPERCEKQRDLRLHLGAAQLRGELAAMYETIGNEEIENADQRNTAEDVAKHRSQH